jgi:hypothetical protein
MDDNEKQDKDGNADNYLASFFFHSLKVDVLHSDFIDKI